MLKEMYDTLVATHAIIKIHKTGPNNLNVCPSKDINNIFFEDSKGNYFIVNSKKLIFRIIQLNRKANKNK